MDEWVHKQTTFRGNISIYQVYDEGTVRFGFE